MYTNCASQYQKCQKYLCSVDTIQSIQFKTKNMTKFSYVTQNVLSTNIEYSQMRRKIHVLLLNLHKMCLVSVKYDKNTLICGFMLKKEKEFKICPQRGRERKEERIETLC